LDQNEDGVAVLGEHRQEQDVALDDPRADAGESPWLSTTAAVEARPADLVPLTRSSGTRAVDDRRSEATPEGGPNSVPEAGRPAGPSARDAARAERGPDTLYVDVVFEAMARNKPASAVSAAIPDASEGTADALPSPERNRPSTPDKAKHDGSEPAPLRRLHARFYAAIALLVVGPVAFYGLRRTKPQSRTAAKVGLGNRPADQPSPPAS
jgi:hypothetical protein